MHDPRFLDARRRARSTQRRFRRAEANRSNRSLRHFVFVFLGIDFFLVSLDFFLFVDLDPDN